MIIYNLENRLVTQFKGKKNLISLLESFVDVEFYESLDSLLNKRGLYTANGFNLDIIGDIVGIKRPFLPVNQNNTFGFYEDDSANTFGDINNANIGSFFYDLTPLPVNTVNDDIYRRIILAKIFINSSNMTVDETIEILSSLLQSNVFYLCAEALSPIYYINRILENYEKDIVKNIGSVFGVNVQYVTNDINNYFGFAEDNNALSFGNLNDLTIGGNLALLL